MKRESGYYWVKIEPGRWVVMEWRNTVRWVFEHNQHFPESGIMEINETRIKNPDEK